MALESDTDLIITNTEEEEDIEEEDHTDIDIGEQQEPEIHGGKTKMLMVMLVLDQKEMDTLKHLLVHQEPKLLEEELMVHFLEPISEMKKRVPNQIGLIIVILLEEKLKSQTIGAITLEILTKLKLCLKDMDMQELLVMDIEVMVKQKVQKCQEQWECIVTTQRHLEIIGQGIEMEEEIM